MTEASSPQRRAATETGAARARLLDATCHLIASDGIGAATSRRITDVAGENLASITYYFGSKGALVAETLVAEVERLVEPAMRALEGDGDPVQRLMGAITDLLRTFADERTRAPAYLAALVEAARGSGGAVGVIGRLRSRLAAVVGQLVADGAVPRWVDPDAMAALIIATANGIALQVCVDPDGPSAEEQAAQLASLFLAAGAVVEGSGR
jgi:AcrR family transcriptional regulator